jgi:hypothetical protein
VASEAALFHALGPDTVPDEDDEASVAVDTAYDNVLFVTFIAVSTKVPLNSAPTPATITVLPTLNPWVAEVVNVATFD